jgi:hypothetical protein
LEKDQYERIRRLRLIVYPREVEWPAVAGCRELQLAAVEAFMRRVLGWLLAAWRDPDPRAVARGRA